MSRVSDTPKPMNGNGNGHPKPVQTGSPGVVVNTEVKVTTRQGSNHSEMNEGVVTNAVQLNSLVRQQHEAMVNNHILQNTPTGKLVQALTNNIGATDLIRTEFLRFLLDGPRNIDADCGYPAWLTPEHFRAMYDREGISRRVVECEPDETWAMDPQVYEQADPNRFTQFETAWETVLEQHNIWHYLHRVDVLSGIGQYGILLLGIDDGLDLSDPVQGVDDSGQFEIPDKPTRLLFLRPFSEEVVFVKTRETDITNPRYGLPTRYTIQFRDFPNWGIQAGEIIARDVHWTRVIHVADRRKISEVYGTPRMQPVYNRLYDLRKIYASSGEAFWKGAFPGIAFEMDPEVAAQGIEIDKESLRKEMEAYQNGLQRYIAVTGLSAKSLPPQVVPPDTTAEAHLKAIAISMAIPYRILFGSEVAVLASTQDTKAWNRRVQRRQTKYVSPLLIRPFLDRLISLGVLPPPKNGYTIDWPDLNTLTDIEKAQVAVAKTQALQGYVMGGVSQLLPPDFYLTNILGMDTEEKDVALQTQPGAKSGVRPSSKSEADKEGADKREEGRQGEEESNEGGINSASTPDQGNALLQRDLTRQTTVGDSSTRRNIKRRGKGKKPARAVDASFVRQPDLNQMGGMSWNAGKWRSKKQENYGAYGFTPDSELFVMHRGNILTHPVGVGEQEHNSVWPDLPKKAVRGRIDHQQKKISVITGVENQGLMAKTFTSEMLKQKYPGYSVQIHNLRQKIKEALADKAAQVEYAANSVEEEQEEQNEPGWDSVLFEEKKPDPLAALGEVLNGLLEKVKALSSAQPPVVNVTLPPAPQPAANAESPRPRRKIVHYDAKGRIASVEEVESVENSDSAVSEKEIDDGTESETE